MREGLFIVGEKRRALCGGLFVQLKQGVEESMRGWRDELLDDLDEERAPSKELDVASMAMESAQRASSLQVTSSLPTLRRELMDIRDLLSN